MNDKSDCEERWRVLFSGRVQGVGFRATTALIADNYQVTGFVRNLPDGRVELVAEGKRSELGKFVRKIEQRLVDCIEQSHKSQHASTKEFVSFSVRY